MLLCDVLNQGKKGAIPCRPATSHFSEGRRERSTRRRPIHEKKKWAEKAMGEAIALKKLALRDRSGKERFSNYPAIPFMPNGFFREKRRGGFATEKPRIRRPSSCGYALAKSLHKDKSRSIRTACHRHRLCFFAHYTRGLTRG